MNTSPENKLNELQARYDEAKSLVYRGHIQTASGICMLLFPACANLNILSESASWNDRNVLIVWAASIIVGGAGILGIINGNNSVTVGEQQVQEAWEEGLFHNIHLEDKNNGV